MTERLKVVLRDLNVSLKRAVDFLHEKGIKIENNPNTKIGENEKELLIEKFRSNKEEKDVIKKIHSEQKEQIKQVIRQVPKSKSVVVPSSEVIKARTETLKAPKSFGRIEIPKTQKRTYDTKDKAKGTILNPSKKELNTNVKKEQSSNLNPSFVEEKKLSQEEKTPSHEEKKLGEALMVKKNQETKHVLLKPEHIETQYTKLGGLTLTGDKVDLSKFEKKPKANSDLDKKRRKRIKKEVEPSKGDSLQAINKSNSARNFSKKENYRYKEKTPPSFIPPSVEKIDKQFKEVLEKIDSKSGKNKAAKLRKEKRILRREKTLQSKLEENQNKIIKVAEFITVNELASMMNIGPIQVIKSCMDLGIMVTMNQRLDAETLVLVADEFGYDIKFTGADLNDFFEQEEQVDKEEDLKTRAPIVTVMGHVDHGKTSLLDYIRKTNVIAGESGGITQHIAAYNVKFKDQASITFLDTPGHEAFTAMRARGAQITDVAIIVIAADDQIMPQTKEAINHAQAAGVPMIFAINKVDKEGANPDKVREQLASMDFLVEEWGGKYQSQEISAKTGLGVDKLLEKVILEAELLELKANPKKGASGTIIEASLDKGRGYVSTILVGTGTLKIGDYVLAGIYHGKIRSIFDERGKSEKEVPPSKPAAIFGLNGAPSAGDKFRVFTDEKEAKQLAAKRDQLQREQNIRTQKHLTLDEIGRRIALGNFRELKIILKADVDGSVEALTDAMQGLSSEEIVVNVIHRAVGQITESDVLLASASDAIIIGFNVRPALGAKNLAEKEKIDIQTYSVIYDAIDDIKEALEGMRMPEVREQILGSAEVREVFKAAKIGTICGSFVLDGKLVRNAKVRVIREGVVIYNGLLSSLKRFKEDVKEVVKNYECGLIVKNYNDIEIKDIVEAYEEVDV